MALDHALSTEPVDVRPLGRRFAHGQTHALFKTAALEVMQLVLAKGKSMPTHAVPGEVIVQCTEGRIDVVADGRLQVLAAGHLLYVSGGVPHSLTALEDATALVTIVLRT